MSTRTISRIRAAAVARTQGPAFGPYEAGWKLAEETEVALEPTPLDSQPSAYVRVAWAGRKHGATPSARVAAAVSDGVLHVRIRWQAADPRTAITDNNVFADSCALLFPADGRDAEIATMGDAERPVEAWHWRAGTPIAFVLRATGLGTSERLAAHPVRVECEWRGGEWCVVFSRDVGAPGVPLGELPEVPVAIAVWQGATDERAGLASHTPRWLRLELPAGGR